MINLHNIAVVDLETDSVDPYSCNPTQLACLMIHPRKLEIIPGSEFNSLIRPLDIDHDDYMDKHKSTIEFHAKNQKATAEQVVSTWKDAPSQKTVWDKFVAYLYKYHTTQSRKSVYTAPIICGYNILNFDCIILDRMCKTYNNIDKKGKSTIFYYRDKIDVMNYCNLFFENLSEPTSYSLDTLREFFGMIKEGSHDALKDVKDTSEIFIKFQKLCRKIAEKTKFKGAFLENTKE